MGHPAPRAALWAFVALLLVSALAALPGAWASSTTTYTLSGWVEQPGTAAPVPKGVTVDLISQATHQTFTTTTLDSNGVPSGQFVFSSGSTGGALAPGWWGVSVPPQARLHLSGCSPCAILPANPNPLYGYYNTTALTTSLYPLTLPNVTVLPYTTTIFGNATNGASPAVNASVQLIAPQYASLVLANATTNRTGAFNFSAPAGTWVLRATLPTSPSAFSYQEVTVSGARMTENPSISSYLTYGHINQASAPAAHVPNGGNATVVDLGSMNVYTYPVPPGGFYAIGGYPANFTGPGSTTFAVVLSIVGYGTVWYPLTVSPSNPTGGTNPHDVLAPAISPPATYGTTLDFSHGFSNLTVNSTAVLGSNAVLPELPNASIGQLWGQLGLDFNHSLTFSSGELSTVSAFLNREGPFFPAAQASTQVNGVSFGANSTFGFSSSSTCAGGCNLSSSASLTLGWQASYNVTKTVSSTLKNYTLGFTFRHPSNAQAFNYTVKLPAGYVLAAGTAPPAGSTLVPSGPGGTWTSFTLVAKPYSAAATTASLPIVKYGNVTANVNVTVANFAFSQKNVLNDTRGNYTVVVGAGENVTFSAVNSSFPAGTNGTLYQWNFGDSSPVSSLAQPIAYHTYSAAGAYDGTLTVTSSGGYTSATSFTVYAGASAPTAVLSVNSTVQSANGVNYTIVNWSTTLHFNASQSAAPLGGFTPAYVHGVLSVASWDFVSHSFHVSANYTAGSGVKEPAATNFTYTFKGAGYYLNGTSLNGVTVAFTGWQYNVSLEVWDGGGHHDNASLVVLVRDTQKPQPLVTLLDSRGRSITSSGVVEGANHTAEVQLSAANSTDPNNGSIVRYAWNVTNPGNATVHTVISQNATAPSYRMPSRPALWLDPQTKPYTVNLTVTDRAGNSAYKVATVVVTVNASQRPVLSVSNLTAPGTMTDGSSYTLWVNVTNTLGQNSTAQNVSVRFYLLPPSGSGSQTTIGGSPGSVEFFNYTSAGVVNSVAFATGLAKIKYNQTVRAVISWNPSVQGTYDVWVNATASNEFIGQYASGANTAHVTVTLNPNPITQYEEYGAIAAVAIAIVVVAYLLYRRSRRGGAAGKGKTPASTKSGLERGKKYLDEDEEP